MICYLKNDLLALGYFLYKSNWDKIQWKIYYLGSLIPLGGFLLTAFFNEEIKFNPIKIRKSIKNWKIKKYVKALDLDLEQIGEIEYEMKSIELLLSTNITLLKNEVKVNA